MTLPCPRGTRAGGWRGAVAAVCLCFFCCGCAARVENGGGGLHLAPRQVPGRREATEGPRQLRGSGLGRLRRGDPQQDVLGVRQLVPLIRELPLQALRVVAHLAAERLDGACHCRSRRRRRGLCGSLRARHALRADPSVPALLLRLLRQRAHARADICGAPGP